MQLPGGVWTRDGLRRDFRFRPVQGHLELAIAESNSGAASTPTRVTRILKAALGEVAGKVPTEQDIADLSVGDRQFLMRQLAIRLDRNEQWYSAECSSCDETFDFSVQVSDLPVKEAGAGYPYAVVTTADGELRLCVPTGREQQALPAELDTESARLWLLKQCIDRGMQDAGRNVPVKHFSQEVVSACENALEQIAPEIGNLVEVNCPVCGAANRVHIDPYGAVLTMHTELFSQIHVLAANYHWSQGEILDLPSSRRRLYLQLIDRARGMMA